MVVSYGGILSEKGTSSCSTECSVSACVEVRAAVAGRALWRSASFPTADTGWTKRSPARRPDAHAVRVDRRRSG